MIQPERRRPDQAAADTDPQVQEAKADERDHLAITRFFRAILQDGFKADCRRVGRVRLKRRG